MLRAVDAVGAGAARQGVGLVVLLTLDPSGPLTPVFGLAALAVVLAIVPRLLRP